MKSRLSKWATSWVKCYLCSDGPPAELSSSSPASGLCSANTADVGKKHRLSENTWRNVSLTWGQVALTLVRTGCSSTRSPWLAAEAPGDRCFRWSSASTACSLNSICFRASAGPGCFHTPLPSSLRRPWVWGRQQREKTEDCGETVWKVGGNWSLNPGDSDRTSTQIEPDLAF